METAVLSHFPLQKCPHLIPKNVFRRQGNAVGKGLKWRAHIWARDSGLDSTPVFVNVSSSYPPSSGAPPLARPAFLSCASYSRYPCNLRRLPKANFVGKKVACSKLDVCTPTGTVLWVGAGSSSPNKHNISDRTTQLSNNTQYIWIRRALYRSFILMFGPCYDRGSPFRPTYV